jgi:hypothetical protein
MYNSESASATASAFQPPYYKVKNRGCQSACASLRGGLQVIFLFLLWNESGTYATIIRQDTSCCPLHYLLIVLTATSPCSKIMSTTFWIFFAAEAVALENTGTITRPKDLVYS